jgi:phage tail P2-like protein
VSDGLPDNATPLERAQSETSLRILATDTEMVRRARDPARAPAKLLPWLAAERSVRRYAGEEAGDRARAASSFGDHLGYGSASALEAEIAADVGGPVEVVEFDQRADFSWPDFGVYAVLPPGASPPDGDALRRAAMRRKNVRDCLAGLGARVVQPAAPLRVGAAACLSLRMTIAPPPARPGPFVGATQRLLPTFRARA